MENNKQPQRSESESEKVQQQNVNPEKLAISDEEQRQTGRESDQQSKKTAVGNEKGKNTEGAEAGMGE